LVIFQAFFFLIVQSLLTISVPDPGKTELTYEMDSIPVRALPEDHGVDEHNIHGYGPARATVKDQPLSDAELDLTNRYFYASM